MSTPTIDKHKEDQAHFDLAWEAREASRAKLGHLGDVAAGPQAGMRQVASQGRKMAEALGDPDEAVAIGRIDAPEEVVYVGRRTILDTEMDPLVVSWASPDAQPFYTATAADPQGLTRKRHFTTSQNRIISVEDLVFKDLAERVERLGEGDLFPGEPTDVLLQDLERDRSNEMRDIVQTIHQSQYHIIERPLEDLLVVQGGPGTGKTAVALHRVAWLLYNFSDILPADGVLVVSPNKAFTEYIRHVLPALGEGEVGHADLTRLGPIRSSGRQEAFETTRLKGSARMADLLHRALWNRVRPPQEATIPVETPTGTVHISADDVRRTIDRWRTGTAPYASRRAELRRILGDLVLRHPGRRSADPAVLERLTERIWPALTPPRLVQDLLGSRQRLTEAAGDDFTAGDMNRLYRQAASNLGAEEWSDSDVALIDEAEWLINGRSSGASHVVVDEAQDLSAMQLRSIARRCPTGSYTIVGDLAQSTGPWARDSWDDVFAALKTRGNEPRLETLKYGYRVPRQVFELAKPLVQHAAPEVEPPIVVRDSPREPVVTPCHPFEVTEHAIREAKEYAGSGLLVGVIAPDALLESLRIAFSDAGINYKSPADGHLGTSINVMSAAQSKGLEFDATVVVEPAGIVQESAHGLRLLYIALTRTTRFTSVVFSENVSEIGLTVMPGTDEIVQAEPVPAEMEQAVSEPITVAAASPTRAPDVRVETPPAKRGSRAERIVAETADEIGADIEATLAKPLHASFIQALADRLGVECLVDD